MGNLKNSDHVQERSQGRILIFGGTIEGRQVSDYLCARHAAHTVCVATEYGEEVLRPHRQDPARMDVSQTNACLMEVHQGRMDKAQMCTFLRNGFYALVVDATHPYAVEVSKNIREACQKAHVPYVRYLREDSAGTRRDTVNSAAGSVADGFAPVYVDSALEAAQYLETRQGGIFLTTGSKELHVFTEMISDKTRLFARVLPSAEVIASCRSLGLEGKQICAMQGPFSLEMNTAMLRQTDCAYLVTKETGASGGFPEKIEAARACQAVAVVIRRPWETGSDWEEVKARLDAAAQDITEMEPRLNMAAQSAPKGKHLYKASDFAESEQTQSVDTAPVGAGGEDGLDKVPRRISCIGIGLGTPRTLTCEAVHEIQKAQALFGAERMLECVYSLFGLHDCNVDSDISDDGERVSQGQTEIEYSSGSMEDSGDALMNPSVCADQLEDLSGRSFRDPFQIRFADEREEERGYPAMVPEYRADKIYEWLDQNPRYRRVAILMSGDVGFYSGAKRIAEVFRDEEVHYICGISSVSYFASRIPTPWQDAKLLSAHGKELPITNYVKKYPKIILLVSGFRGVRELSQTLASGEFSGIRMTVGSNLSYPQERIEAGAPGDFLDYQPPADGPCIMMIENPDAGQIVTPGIPDDRFERTEKVPMTKEEIRALSVAKLRLREDSVVYDIGAGTGSVSVECARLCTKGAVYAIERNQNALEVVQQNCRRFGLSNVMPVHAAAPEGLEELPVPTHAFVGGSSGNMKAIIEVLLKKNPQIRIVINTVTLESIAEATDLIRELKIADADIVQISAAKAGQAGRYHLMNALNPVFIVSFGGAK